MNISMNMESSSSLSSSLSCNTKKRKNAAVGAHVKAKRLKTEQEGDEALQSGRLSCSPRVSVPLDCLQQPITLNELTELLHYAALGKTGGIKQPSWCRLRHQRKVKGLNVVIVEGLTQSHFYKHYLSLRHLRTKYTTRVTFTPSCNNVASGIFSSELPTVDCVYFSKPENDMHNALKGHPVIAKFGTQRRGLTAYVLTQEEMIKKHYPVKGMPGFEEFVSTDSVDCVTDSSPLYGLDCEMCLTEKGNELTRVSVVDSDGNCVLDHLVKPKNRILNYLTRFSGVTAAMLRPITTTLRDVQEKLRKLLPGDAVLVGHSINNDLMALKLIHQHVIDTSLLYRREFGQRFKLKVLAETVLKRQIQTEEEKGHNPTEDAVAALELAQYFIKTGPRQVVELHLEQLWGYTIEEEESSDCKLAPTPSLRFADVLQLLGRSVAFFGKRSDVALNLSNQRWYSSDKEMLESFKRQTKHPFLSVVQFSSFSDHLKRRFPHRERLHRSVCADLRDMCVVFAGPFPAGFSEREVRRLFRCCGPVGRIKMLNTSVRVHAEVEFELLEGATLALKTLNGLNVQGQHMKVQRPVNESLLDLDLTLDTLTDDILNTSHLYAVKLKPSVAECIKISAEVNGHTLDRKCSGVSPVNGLPAAKTDQLQLTDTRSKLSEETVTETFGRFGTVERVILPAKPGKHTRHACIKFQSSEGKHAALSSSKDLRQENYLICQSLTPPHLPSWVAMATPVTTIGGDGEAAEDENKTNMGHSSQDLEMDHMMQKLDRRLGKLFRSLPDGTLSAVVLLGHTSVNGHLPGLCLMEVKQGS
ncbi:RNA exonuclease 5 isoform X5 [Acanthochromis polyacanthus]|uniref:RNA exonuclease 5 isoform X5 n=1 Tax=Acanthochromis polyacanthus TaxID=80966 RepID=UPI002234929E|nr:RNA exonuclease 5 isoform X5 [Acanthochromis polyacanthus]